MLEQIIYSAIGTFIGLWMLLTVFGVAAFMQRDRIKNKVDEKVDEKKQEIMGGIFQ